MAVGYNQRVSSKTFQESPCHYDVVVERAGNLQAELLKLLQVDLSTPAQGLHDLYATAQRTVSSAPGLLPGDRGLTP